jgi:hypothetical protein
MSNETRRRELRDKLSDDIMLAIDSVRVDIGQGLTNSDVVGVLEWAKLQLFVEAAGFYGGKDD